LEAVSVEERQVVEGLGAALEDLAAADRAVEGLEENGNIGCME
jgi:hypothetical protein